MNQDIVLADMIAQLKRREGQDAAIGVLSAFRALLMVQKEMREYGEALRGENLSESNREVLAVSLELRKANAAMIDEGAPGETKLLPMVESLTLTGSMKAYLAALELEERATSAQLNAYLKAMQAGR